MLLQVYLTIFLLVALVIAIVAVVTRPLWTAAWRRWHWETRIERTRGELTSEERRQRSAAAEELDESLRPAAPAAPETPAEQKLHGHGEER